MQGDTVARLQFNGEAGVQSQQIIRAWKLEFRLS
jgi:hypothetical protein